MVHQTITLFRMCSLFFYSEKQRLMITPIKQHVASGSTAYISCRMFDSHPKSVKWSLNGADIIGAQFGTDRFLSIESKTGSVLQISPVKAYLDNGTYTCEMVTASGFTIRRSAVLDVYADESKFSFDRLILKHIIFMSQYLIIQ